MKGAEGLGLLLAGDHFHDLHEMFGRQRAFGHHEARVVLQARLGTRLADLHRDLEIFGAGSPAAAVAAAALDDGDSRLAPQAPRPGRLGAHSLPAASTAQVLTDPTL